METWEHGIEIHLKKMYSAFHLFIYWWFCDFVTKRY
jgi:hypothetical protein